MIQLTKHHAKWHLLGLIIIVLVTAFFVVKLIHDARRQPVAVQTITIEK